MFLFFGNRATFGLLLLQYQPPKIVHRYSQDVNFSPLRLPLLMPVILRFFYMREFKTRLREDALFELMNKKDDDDDVGKCRMECVGGKGGRRS